MDILGVIPARFASTRLPGKPLISIAGKPLVRWVYEAALKCKRLNGVVIATDDERIVMAAKTFGATAVMTSPDLPSGTDRCYAALGMRKPDIVVNIQGDEPLMNPANVDAAVEALIADPEAGIASAMIRIRSDEDFHAPQVVKVVCDLVGRAMYFSRAPIPDRSRLSASELSQATPAMKHVGLYVYRGAVLHELVQMSPSRLELTEKLEQLRWLEAGYRIRMVEVHEDTIGVDTPEDVARVEPLLR